VGGDGGVYVYNLAWGLKIQYFDKGGLENPIFWYERGQKQNRLLNGIAQDTT